MLDRGKPLSGGHVKFEPDAGREAHGDIRPDGTFVLSTFGDGDGAGAGLQRVAVSGAVPPKFGGYASSELEVTVEPGKDEYALELR